MICSSNYLDVMVTLPLAIASHFAALLLLVVLTVRGTDVLWWQRLSFSN